MILQSDGCRTSLRSGQGDCHAETLEDSRVLSQAYRRTYQERTLAPAEASACGVQVLHPDSGSSSRGLDAEDGMDSGDGPQHQIRHSDIFPLTSPSPGASRSAGLAAHQSLRWRLPLLISALILAMLTTFLLMAYRQVEGTFERGAGERAQTAADQLANLFIRSTQQGLEGLGRAATDPVVRRYLQQPNDVTRDEARKRLAVLAPIGPRSRRIELWDDSGTRVLEISSPAPQTPGNVTVAPLPSGMRPVDVGVSAFRVQDGVVFSD